MSEERRHRVEKAMRNTHVLIEVCRLHGLDSTVFKHSLDDNMPDILSSLAGISRLDIEFADGRICFGGQPLSRDEQQFRQLSRIMNQAGIHVLILRSGVKNDEFAAFVHILTAKKEQIQRQGIKEILREEQITHIEAGGTNDIVGVETGKSNVYTLDSDGPVFSIE